MKLVVLTGPIQGKVLDLAKGNNFIGRAEENSITLPSGQISRRHACVSLLKGRVFLEDLGSSNGTFQDGKRLDKKVELKPGTRFQMGEFVLELSADGQVAQPGGPPAGQPRATSGPVMPIQAVGGDRDKGSLFWLLYQKIAFLGWLGQMILLSLGAAALIVLLCIYPLLREEQQTLTNEVLKRGAVLVNRLAMRNGTFIKNHQETNLDTAQIMTEQGITEAYLLNKELRILSPVEQRGRALVNSVSREAFTKGGLVVKEEPEVKSDGGLSGVYHIAMPIRVWSADRGIYENYGIAYIVVRARKLAEANADSDGKFAIATTVVVLVLLLYLIAVALLTVRPLKALVEDAELVLRGDLRSVESRARWKELKALAHSLNRSFDRYHQAMSGNVAATSEAAGPSFLAKQGESKGDGSIEDAKVEAIARAVSQGVLITDEMQRVLYINSVAERMLGAQLDRARNRHIMEVVTNRDLLGSVLDVFKQLMNSQEPTVTMPVTIQGPKGELQMNLVASGVRGRDGHLSYAAIVIR